MTITQALTYLRQAISIALVVLFAATLVRYFGVRVPVVKSFNPTEFAYLAGAWWLIVKAGW